MQNNYNLYIEETGLPDITNENPYILCGCSVLESDRVDLKIQADRIKYKYWGHTKVNFHSIDIARDSKEFKIFKGKKALKKQFIQDLLEFLYKAPIFVNAIVIEKEKAKLGGWIQREKLIYESAAKLLQNFILLTYSKGRVTGKIIIESASDKDPYYLKAFNFFQSNGVPFTTLSHREVKNTVTSISFVTKQNNDIETQIADLLSYGAKIKLYADTERYIGRNKAKLKPGKYEYKLLKIFEKKLYKIHPNTGKKKRKILKHIDSFANLPI